MFLFSRLIAFAAALLGLSAWSIAGERVSTPAYHPTVVFAEEAGNWLPIFAADADGKPLVKSGETTRALPAKSRLRFKRANNFKAGFVNLAKPDGHVSFWGDGSFIVVDALSDRPMTHCMAAVFAYDAKKGKASGSDIPIALCGIPDLKPGALTQVLINFPDSSKAGYDHVLLIFSEGYEVQTSMSDTAAAFFRRIESDHHVQLLQTYKQKFQGANHPAEPYLRFPPIFPAGTMPEGLPAIVHLTMEIDADGFVANPRLQETVSAPAGAAILRTVGSWLYMPELKGGTPQATTKTAAIQLRELPTAKSAGQP